MPEALAQAHALVAPEHHLAAHPADGQVQDGAVAGVARQPCRPADGVWRAVAEVPAEGTGEEGRVRRASGLHFESRFGSKGLAVSSAVSVCLLGRLKNVGATGKFLV